MSACRACSVRAQRNGAAPSLPLQLALVPGLRRLSISCAAYSAHSMAKLARLTALTRLSLDGLEYCPPGEPLLICDPCVVPRLDLPSRRLWGLPG